MENEGTKKKRSWKKRLAVAVVLILLLYGVFLFLHTRLGITATVQLWNDRLEKTAERMLEEKPDNGRWWHADEQFMEYKIIVPADCESVYFETSAYFSTGGLADVGFYYSVDGTPQEYGNDEVTFREYEDGWLWEEENGNNWVYTVHITGNWYWYERHL